MSIKRYNIDEFWKIPIYVPYLQEVLDANKIRECEDKVGFKLPSSLVDLLYVQNGGYVNAHGYGGLHVLSGIGPDRPNITELTRQMRKDNKSYNSEKLVALDGDGHYYICLDYRENDLRPKVVHVDFECDTESILAETFKDHILYEELNEFEMEDAEGNFLLAVNLELHQCCQKILEINSSFDLQNLGDRGQGYLEYQIIAKDRIVCLLSSNEVNKYYAGSLNQRAVDLNIKGNPKALRYKDLPPVCTLILGLDDSDPYRVRDWLAERYETRELFDL